jgi:Cu(I)/Ag(I) efflux system membrane fusion protein
MRMNTSIKFAVLGFLFLACQEVAPEQFSNSDLASTPVVKATWLEKPAHIFAQGKVDYDERFMYNVSARVSGRIEKLYVKYPNIPVKKGEKILELYSAELVSLQKHLLLLQSQGEERLVKENTVRLLRLGLSQKEIDQLLKTQTVLERVPVHSPFAGVAHFPEIASTGEMSAPEDPMGMGDSKTRQAVSSGVLEEGAYLSRGQTFLQIAEHKKLWVWLAVPRNQADFVYEGDWVKLQNGTQNLETKIDFIPLGQKDPSAFWARASIEEAWQVGTSVQAEIISSEPYSGLFLPKTAVSEQGLRRLVWKKTPQGFQAQEVLLGISLANDVQILQGINAEDEIVKNAAYLLDSDTFINP